MTFKHALPTLALTLTACASSTQVAAHPGGRGGAPVPGLPASPGRADQAAGQDRLPVAEALTATEQAIQLDELIGWVRRQHAVNPNARASAFALNSPAQRLWPLWTNGFAQA